MHPRFLLLFASFAAPLCAQTTHFVGPGGFAQIRDALAVASPGDTLYVAPGTYAHFTCSVGVGIRAIVPGTVSVAFDLAALPPGCTSDFACMQGEGPTRFEPPAGQSVHVSGIEFVPNVGQASLILMRHRVVVTSGTVTFDGCTISAFGDTALRVTEAIVHLQDCVVAPEGFGGFNGGLTATDAHVIAVDTELSGGVVSGGAGLPGVGAMLVNSTLQASGCVLLGGTTSPTSSSSAPALSVLETSRVWISDSSLSATTCAITGTPAVGQIARSTVSSGSSSCTTLTTAPLVGVERPNPIHNGAAFTVNLRTEPHTLVAIHASPRLGHLELPGLFAQPLSLDVTSFFLAGVFVSDANGDLTASWNMPAGQYVDETVWVEPMAFLPTSILVGPPVGGLIR